MKKEDIAQTDKTVLKIIQIIFGFLGLLGIGLILNKYGGTSSCIAFDIAYKTIFILFTLSLSISALLYKRFHERGIILYIPLIFAVAFLLILISYHLNYINIYDQVVGGDKTYQDYKSEGGVCDRFLIKLFSK